MEIITSHFITNLLYRPLQCVLILSRIEFSCLPFVYICGALVFETSKIRIMSEEDSIEYESEEEDEDTEGSEEEEEEEVEVKVIKKKRGKSNKKDPNKPKRNMSAFFIYSNAHRKRIKEENPDIKFGEVARALSTEFKALGSKEKKKYEKLAEKDKERYQTAMSNYVPPSDDSDDDRRKKPKKDPNKPKRNLSAFFMYSNAVREDVRKENPEAKFGDIARLISGQFKALDKSERAIYDQQAADDKVRYVKQMEKYSPP